MRAISEIWDVIIGEWWNSVDGSKRKIMAECLAPGFIPPDLIHSIYDESYSTAEKVKKMLYPKELPITPAPHRQRRGVSRLPFSINGDGAGG
jgi:hypothetical protein